MVNRTESPAIVSPAEFDLQLLPYQRFQLTNGIPVYVIDGGAEDVISVELVYEVGSWQDEKNLIAKTTAALMKTGTSSKTAFEINEHFEYYGSSLQCGAGYHHTSFGFHSLVKHLPELLPVMQEVLEDPIFPQSELDLYKQNRAQQLTVNLEKSSFVASRHADECVFGIHHPYGTFTTTDDIAHIEREDLVEFYTNYLKTGSCTLFIAGKIPNNLQVLLQKHFGDIPQSRVKLSYKAIQPLPEKKHRISLDEKGVQGSVRLATNFYNRHHPHFMTCQVLNTIFGGYFGSRLMNNIREDKGYTYGIHSYLTPHMQEGAWIISTEAGKDVCEATIQEVYNEMKLLREVPVEEDELALVKNYLFGKILGDLDGPFPVIARWKNIVLNGFDASYFYNNLRTIRSISAQEIQSLANIYLQPENFYEIVVI